MSPTDTLALDHWRDIADKPSVPVGALLWFPLQEHEGVAFGGDYRIQIGHWDGRGWCYQGTNHDVMEEAMTFGPGGEWSYDERALPTHWLPLPHPPSATPRGAL